MKVKGFLLSVLLLLGCFGFKGCENFGCMTVNMTWYFNIPNTDVKVFSVNEYTGEREPLEKRKSSDENIAKYELPYYHHVTNRKNYKASVILLLVYPNEAEELIYSEFMIPYLDSRDGVLEKELSYSFNNNTQRMNIKVYYHFSQTI